MNTKTNTPAVLSCWLGRFPLHSFPPLRRCGALVFAALATGALLPDNAHASEAAASVSTFFADFVGKGDQNGGSIAARASASDAQSGASASGNGSATGTTNGSLFEPAFHAFAQGSSNGDHTVGGNANVTVSWKDSLRYDDVQIVDPDFLLSTFIYFQHHLSGSISNPQSASFSVDIDPHRFDKNGNPITFSGFRDLTGPINNFSNTLTLRLPANALIYDTVNGKPNYATYTIELFIGGGSAYGPGGAFLGDGTTDFSGTAALDTIYFGDANGNPVSTFHNIHVLGDNGQYVMGAPAPEPGSGLLLVIGAGALMGGARLRAKHRYSTRV